MVEIGSPEIQDFLQQLGARYPGTGTLYLLGGSALCLLGSTRRTLDIDYTLKAPTEEVEQLQAAIEALVHYGINKSTVSTKLTEVKP